VRPGAIFVKIVKMGETHSVIPRWRRIEAGLPVCVIELEAKAIICGMRKEWRRERGDEQTAGKELLPPETGPIISRTLPIMSIG
jgi:hypothetical protein